jgi:hypothetical protein
VKVPGRCLTTLAFACVAACVPRGDPPTGRQIVADRTSAPLTFIASNGDGKTRLLVARPSQDQSTRGADLSVVTLDPSGGEPVERLLATDVVNTNDFSLPAWVWGHGSCGGTDARGRLFVSVGGDFYGNGPASDLVRIDAVTGDRLDLGPAATCLQSASSDRLLVIAGKSATLFDADDQPATLDTTQATFVGEDLYYVTSQHELVRLSPGGGPQPLASGVGDMEGFVPSDSGPALLLSRPTQDQLVSTYSVLDLTTGQETPWPFPRPGLFSVSPDKRWLLTTALDTDAVAFVDWRTGEQRPISLPSGEAGGYFWRPGHDEEVWFVSGDQPLVSMRAPDGRAADYPIEALGFTDNMGGSSIFTPDGAFLFSRRPSSDSYAVQVGSADDPTGPAFALPGGNLTQYWPLPDGRLLVGTFTSTPELINLYAVDPTTGDTRPLGDEGQVLAVGQSRLVVNQHLIEHEGDLTVIQLASGQATVLAPEFAASAAVEPLGSDDAAPGAQVAFRFQARFPSPYDGIWLATVP